MAISFLSTVKMAVLLVALLALLINPTFSSSPSSDNHVDGGDDDLSLLPPSPAPPADGFRFKCPKFDKLKMAERIVGRVNASHKVKAVLRKSAVFADCVAAKVCNCFKLRFEPLIFACFGYVEGFCMARAMKGHAFDCTLGCVNNYMLVNNIQRLDNERIVDSCYSKCVKNI